MTQAPLFSSSWYRVAELQPRLRSHAQIHRHRYRGQTWYVLEDRASQRHHRFTPQAHLLIGLMDGQRTVQELWEIACDRLGDETFEAGPGEIVWAPKGIPHGVENKTAERLTLLVTIAPPPN